MESLWEGLSRATWQQGQMYLGEMYSHTRNRNSKTTVERFNGGVLVNQPYNKGQKGATLGNYINGWNLKTTDSMFKHEYGHIVQSRRLGFGYFIVIAASPFSVLSDNLNKRTGVDRKHGTRWYEEQADRFGNYY